MSALYLLSFWQVGRWSLKKNKNKRHKINGQPDGVKDGRKGVAQLCGAVVLALYKSHGRSLLLTNPRHSPRSLLSVPLGCPRAGSCADTRFLWKSAGIGAPGIGAPAEFPLARGGSGFSVSPSI